MDKKPLIQEGQEKTSPQLPLGQLFYLLYSNGFSVKPDDYIEMLKITERFGSHDIDETARWICPIIATNEMEQAKFYNIIDQYKKLTTLNDKEEEEKRKRKRRIKIAATVAAALLLFLVVYYSLLKREYPLPDSRIEKVVEKGTTQAFDALDLLQAPEDSADIQFAWQFGDGSEQKGLRANHVFRTAGDHFVKRQFTSRTFSLPKKADSLLIHVCDDLPGLQLIPPEKAITAKQPVNFTALVNAAPGTVSYYQWTINDSVFTTQQPVVENIVFSSEGDFIVQCRAVVGSVNSPCTVTEDITVKVQDDGMHYNAAFSATRPGSYAAKATLKWWANILFLLPAAACIFYGLFKRKPKKIKAEQKAPVAESVNKGPFDIPFEQNDLKLIQQDRDLRRTFIQMRYRAEEETLVLSVPATISGTIRSGGCPQLVYTPFTQQQQYLVLIDRANPKSMLTRLFSWLVNSIAEDGIPVAIFYYDKNFTCYNETFPAGLSLQRLAETHTNATLIIMGKAYELVYSPYLVIEEKFLKELNRWQSKAIITPIPIKDWSAKEKILLQYFILLPADTGSLQKLMPALREKIKPNTSQLEITDAAQYSLKDTDFQDINALRRYLNNDDTLFQWLCAICIYPRLSWELLVELGKAILDKNGEPEKLNYTNLLKLSRISWMQQGVFPQITRLELLKILTVENEICARERLLHMLDYSTGLYGEASCFFEEEKKRQQLTNQFILHASDNELFLSYADSRDAFQKIWKKDAILDMPLKRYLDKTEKDTWTTPVSNGQQSVGLAAYFDQQEIIIQKSSRVKKGLALAAAVLLLALWAYMGYGGGAKKLEPLLILSQENNPPTIPLSVKVIKVFKACGDTSNRSFDQLDGYLEMDEEKIPLIWNEQDATASFEIPYKSMVAGKASMMLSWTQNKSVTIPIVFTNRLFPDSVSIACSNRTPASKPPLYIRYNDSAGYREIENELANALYQYNISALPANFKDSSRIVYYEPNQQQRADSIVAIMAQSLGINLAKEFIGEERSPAATPILFLNTATTDSVIVDDLEEKKAKAREHHLLGDKYYDEKLYQQALDEYALAINLDPADALAYYNRGLCYEALANANKGKNLNIPNLEKALIEYNAAISLYAKDALSWYRKASIKYSLKRYAQAIPDYSKVISINSPEMKKQVPQAVYFRGKSYYFLKDLSRACEDFKRSAGMGVNAGKQDYTTYCGKTDPAEQGNKTAAAPAISNARLADMLQGVAQGKMQAADFAAYLNKPDIAVTLDGTRMSFATLCESLKKTKSPGTITITSTKDADGYIVSMAVTTVQPVQATEKNLGYIELDQKGYTDAQGQQVMQNVSGLLKAQPAGKIRLTASYTSEEEQKMLTGYMKTIVDMFSKIGVNSKTQVEQRIEKNADQAQQQYQNKEPVQPAKKLRIHVTGINLKENSATQKKK